MSTSLSSLRKNSSLFLDKIKTETEKITARQSYDDPRFWEPEVDPKTGNGSAIIRFLPPAEGEDVPWTRVFRHSFQGPTGKWFIDNCLTTIGQDCPVCEANNKLWNTNIDSNKEIVRKRKRQLTYISNIYVVSDPNRKENEGKIFLFKYGKKIFDKINNLLHPEFDDEVPTNPFDFWEGCNFRLKIRKVEGYRNYDKSVFDEPSVLNEDEQELTRIYESLIPLSEFTSKEQFKDYDTLKSNFNKVWSSTTVTGSAEDEELDDGEDEAPKRRSASPKPTRKPIAKKKSDDEEDDVPWSGSNIQEAAGDDEEDALARFKKLASED